MYSTKLESLNEIGAVLDKYYISKLNQDEENNLNKATIRSKKIEELTNRLPTSLPLPPKNNSQRLDGFSTESYQTFKEEVLPIILKQLYKIETEETQPNSFDETTFTLIL